jgi:DNA-binding XRE family transcriptional regulator
MISERCSLETLSAIDEILGLSYETAQTAMPRCDALSVDALSKMLLSIMPIPPEKLASLLNLLGVAIRDRRQSLNLSQEALAEAANFDRTYISLLERGQRNPSFSNLCRVAAAMNITPSKLLQGIEYGT